ncbi:SH3 domain-containing protein [Peptostreptococcus porci]|uniref:SH3 domain-containing protein n=1 Tax=Peptostreptococcus porci TaxID=2652282 RepID=UPI003AB96ED5
MNFLKSKLAMSALALLPFVGTTAMASGQTGVINFEFVNIRVNPSINNSVKFVLKKGDKVEILSEKDGWYNIKSGNKDGWVAKNAVTLDAKQVSNVKTSPQQTAKYKEVANDILNLRSGASTNSSILAVLHKGDRLKVIDEAVGWTKVEFNGQVGFVSSRLVKDVGTTTVSASTESNSSSVVKRVISNKLNMRKSSEITSERVKTLNRGQLVNFISEKNGWAKISVDGVTGYVSSYYLENTGESSDDVIESAEDVSADFGNTSVEVVDDNNVKENTTPSVAGGISYKNMGMSLSNHVNLQSSKALNLNSSNGWGKASTEELTYYMNPQNHTSYSGMMQFLALDSYSNDLTVDQLNSYLNKYCKSGNVFHNQGQAFINAAKKNNINVLYLVAHSMIETGYGTSKLASGVQYNGKTVYNFFGIGAVDGNALAGGSATAYKNGWTSVAAGIDGAATWISQRYIHNSQYNQNTLYEMKWSTGFTWHQYASDISWPKAIGNKMADIGKYSSNLGALRYIVPQYN